MQAVAHRKQIAPLSGAICGMMGRRYYLEQRKILSRFPTQNRCEKARQQVATAPSGIRRRPTLPGRFQPSTISVLRLNFCVRYGNRWIPQAIATGNSVRSHLQNHTGDSLQIVFLRCQIILLRSSSSASSTFPIRAPATNRPAPLFHLKPSFQIKPSTY